MIRSYDIFDTCLTRRVAEPAEVFDLVGRSEDLGDSFKFFRQEAEREATRRHGDATLAEIHDILASWMGYGALRRDHLIAAELEEEERQLIPIPDVLTHIEEHRRRNGRISFLSDMYLPASFLEERLREYGFFQDDDILLVSCECRKSKTSGALYQEARKQLGETTWEHFGNHLHADVKAATRAGLKGTYRPWGNLGRHEETLLSWARDHGGSARTWAGAARRARMNSGTLSRDGQIIAEVSAGVAGPLVFIFASWLVERAAARGLDILFFLARDGQVFMEAFNQIASAKGIQTEARYLHASRIALRFPRDFPLSDQDAAGVFQGSGYVPASVVAARLGISEARLREWIPAGCIEAGLIDSGHFPRVRSILASPAIVSELAAKAAQRSEILRDYLRQEGFLDTKQPAVVDLGWNGSLQAGLQRVLHDEGSKSSVHGLYLGLASFPHDDSTAEAMLYDNRDREGEFAHWTTAVAEVLCQADHGSVLGFTKNESGGISAVMDQPDGENPLVRDWFAIHRNTIQSFVGESLERTPPPIATSAYKRLLIRLLEGFWLNPSPDEARVWGACCFASHGIAETRVAMASSPTSIGELLAILGIRNSRSVKSLWREGSAAKLPVKLPLIAKGVRKLRSYLRRRFQ